MTSSGRFRQADLTRALKAMRAAGLGVAKVEISSDGTISIIPGQPEVFATPNPWDEVLDLDWRERQPGLKGR